MRGMEKWGASFGYAPQENVEAIIADARAAVPQVKAVLYFECQGDPLLRLLTPLPSDEELAAIALDSVISSSRVHGFDKVKLMWRFFGVKEGKRRPLRLRYESAAKKARLVMAAATTRVRAEADAAKEAAAAREAAATEEARAVATVATLVATGREALAKEIAMESVAREVAIEQAAATIAIDEVEQVRP